MIVVRGPRVAVRRALDLNGLILFLRQRVYLRLWGSGIGDVRGAQLVDATGAVTGGLTAMVDRCLARPSLWMAAGVQRPASDTQTSGRMEG